jgi:hypothetical protein
MSPQSLRFSSRLRLAVHALAAGILMWPMAAVAEPSAGTVSVNVDQARLVKLPARVATIVVGNPLIADVALQAGGVLVVTGKGYGATNFIAMDRSGEVLVDRLIQVEGPTDQLITVYRGVDRESYSCMPTCQRRVTLGDGDNYFKSAMDQAGNLSKKAAPDAAFFVCTTAGLRKAKNRGGRCSAAVISSVSEFSRLRADCRRTTCRNGDRRRFRS